LPKGDANHSCHVDLLSGFTGLLVRLGGIGESSAEQSVGALAFQPVAPQLMDALARTRTTKSAESSAAWSFLQ